MRPILFDAGFWQLNGYGTMILLGTLASMPGSYFDARTRGIGRRAGESPLSFFLDLYIVLFVGTVVGGRALFVLTSPEIFIADPARIFRLDAAGFVFFGSFFGIVVGLIYLARKYGRPTGEVMDLFTTWLPITHLGGRLGCFLAGCCYGAPTTSSLGVSFPDQAIAYQDPAIPHMDGYTVALHPTQLYEAAGLAVLAIWLVTTRLRRGPQPPWMQASRYALGYGVLRLFVELFRGDAERKYLVELTWPALSSALKMEPSHILGISTSQAVSAVLISLGVLGLRRAWAILPRP